MIASECSYAGFINGNELAEWMQEYNKFETGINSEIMTAGRYSGYIGGVADTTNHIIWCSPQGIEMGQVRKIVDIYLSNNPEKLHLDASSLIIEALKTAFPCKKVLN